MAKVPMHMRLEESLIRRIDAYAASRLSNRTAVVQAACLAFLEDANGGVPELEEAVESRRAPGPVSKGPSRIPAAPPSPRVPTNVPGVTRGSDVLEAKPERTSFESGEEWQTAVRLWRAREDR